MNKSVKITADSTCDLSPELCRALGVTLAPLYITAGDRSFRDGVDISPADIFRHVDTHGTMCATSAVNIFDYEKLFGEHAPHCEAVIHICLGKDFSACYQNAKAAAESFANVHVVDSQSLSSGSGIIVYDAALMAKDGMPAAHILEKIERDTALVDCSFVIDRLDYLHKGGRCSGMEALGARLLHIKPSIEVSDGRMGVGKKYKGSFQKCLQQYVGDKLEDIDSVDTQRIFITHPMCPDDIVEAVKAAVTRRAAFGECIVSKAGCTISSHCGPLTLGIIFKRKA
ncbi:MAG: DegV family protein [Oscillospiraceae bacterium]|jgi:DegV family protein with EDD domain|nr:DegV family protein [Oscillospiraceae bacterium]